MSLLLKAPTGVAVRLTSAWHQLSLSPGAARLAMLDVAAAHLQNVGQEPIHVEARDGEGQPYHLTAFLDATESCPVGANTRFFVSGQQEETTHYLLDAPPEHEAAQGGASAALPCGAGKQDTAGSPGNGGGKRQRLHGPGHPPPSSSPAAELPRGAALAAGAAADDPLDAVPDAPVHLMRVRGIPDWANEGFLGLRLADVVRGGMRWCLACNYMMDLAWLLSACPDLLAAPRLVLVHGEAGAARAKLERDVEAAGLLGRATLFAPQLPIAYGTHHRQGKAFIVEYGRGLRIVIFTANAIYPDCNNKSQGLFWQDFPPKDEASPEARLRPAPQLAPSAPTSAFQQDLAAYLAALKLPPSVARHCRDLLGRHDFSAARVHLVASVPGYHRGGAELHRWGHMRLRALLNREPPFPVAFRRAPLVAQFSSLGSLDDKWLSVEFRASLAAGRCGGGGEQLGLPAAGHDGLRIAWPTGEEVQNSLEGWAAGASIPGRTDTVSRPFLQPYYSRWGGEVCGRQRAMPHIKSYLRYRGQDVAWLYVGSHNLSKAAWGALQKDASQLMVRSFELGVLVVPSREAAYRASRWCGFSCTSSQPWQQQQPAPAPDDGKAAPASSTGAAGAPAAPSVRFVQWQRGGSQDAGPAPGGGGELIVPLPIPYSLPPQQYQQGDKAWVADGVWQGLDSTGCDIEHTFRQHYGLLDWMPWGQGEQA